MALVETEVPCTSARGCEVTVQALALALKERALSTFPAASMNGSAKSCFVHAPFDA